MKSSIVLTALAVASGLCAAQEVGRVISSTPVVQQVAVPRQVCGTDSVAVPAQRSGAGAALGALAGGAVGNAVGHGGGRALATMIGIFGGAVVGDRVEGTGGHAVPERAALCYAKYPGEPCRLLLGGVRVRRPPIHGPDAQ